MMTVFLIGLLIGVVATRMVCQHQHAIELSSRLSQVERTAYARGYEHGSLPGQRVLRKTAVTTKGPILASELEPTVLARLVQRWVTQGKQLNCHAWLAVLAAINIKMGLLMAAGLAGVICAVRYFVEHNGFTTVDEATSEWLLTRGDHQPDEEEGEE